MPGTRRGGSAWGSRPGAAGEQRRWSAGTPRPAGPGLRGGARASRPGGPGDTPGTRTSRPEAGGAPRLEIPDSITADQLDPAAAAELRTLPGDLADAVARRLVAAAAAEDPDRAYLYAQEARRLAARVGIVRETSGVAAYRAGRWADALAELRAARRLTGRTSYLPLMADSERALGRLDRALALINDPGATKLDRATEIELLIVESGVRRDQGLPDAAVVALQVPELSDGRMRPWSARLFYAYADALLDAGREDEARAWFGRAAAADTADETDAAERCEELDQILIDDLMDPADGDPADGDPADGDPADG
jgi:tetratricopeptide (TPR) repeat protein